MIKFMPIALAALAILVMAPSLGSAPVYLHHDEVLTALNGYALASTGHDLNGQRLPLFILTTVWVPPMAMYLRALTFMLVPMSEITTRLPGVFIGVLDVVLTYFVGRRLFGHVRLAALAALLVLLTPAHFIHVRLGVDHVCGVPFTLAFLLGFLKFIERRRLATWFAANLCLGVGMYSYNGSITSMPVFFVLGCGWLFAVHHIRSPRIYVAGLTAFVLPLVPLIFWFVTHPAPIGDLLGFYGVAGSVASHSAPVWLADRLNIYYYFFNPALLFFQGDSSLIDSTREDGIFLLPFAVLLPLGAYHILTHRRTSPDHFMLLAFLAAPLGGIMVDDVKVMRVLAMVPIAAFVATRGVAYLASRGTVAARTAAAVLLVGSVWQFQLFYRDYFTGYRERSAPWFDRNRGGAMEAVLARADDASAIYVSDTIPMVKYFWQFYAIKHGRPDLIDRVVYFDRGFNPETAPAGSVLMSEIDASGRGVVQGVDALTRIAVIDEADGKPAFAVYRK
jgi:4-amino-4-deoxy-L-arabinose transferase-like glycosyltransferase